MDLNVITRTETGKGVARKCRQKGFIPAIMYGNKKESKALSIEQKTLLKYITANGTSRMLSLSIDGEKHMVLFKDIDRNALTGIPFHVDFFEIDPNKPVERTVALKFEGTPIGVATQGGMLMILKHEILISCLPKDIPEKALIVNVDSLELNSNLFASSIKLPEGLTLISSHDMPIAQVNLPKEEVKVEAVESAEGTEGAEGAEGAEGVKAADGAKGAKDAKKPEPATEKKDGASSEKKAATAAAKK